MSSIGHQANGSTTRDRQREAAGERYDDHYTGSVAGTPAAAPVKPKRTADSELKTFAALVRLLDKLPPHSQRNAVRYLSERYDQVNLGSL